MKQYRLTYTTRNVPKGHRCYKCGKPATEMVVAEKWWTNIGEHQADKVYLCKDCSWKVIGKAYKKTYKLWGKQEKINQKKKEREADDKVYTDHNALLDCSEKKYKKFIKGFAKIIKDASRHDIVELINLIEEKDKEEKAKQKEEKKQEEQPSGQ